MNLTTPLDDLMPGLRGHVLTVLLRSPRPLTGREVAHRAGTVSHSSVKLILDSLATAGIVRLSLVSGAGHFYELNHDHVLTEPLCQMDRALDEFLAMAQRLILSWPTAPLSVALFGSVARGTSAADSDVDLLIIWPDDLSDAPWWRTARVEFTNQLQAFVGSSVSLVEFSLNDWHEAIEHEDPFTESIRDEGRSVYGADVRDLVAATRPAALA
ncbi:MAG: nucleotidyltransferase domain-containing protein [Sporichthyaceae bacterium]